MVAAGFNDNGCAICDDDGDGSHGSSRGRHRQLHLLLFGTTSTVVEAGGDDDDADRSGTNPSLSSRFFLPDLSLSSSGVGGWHDDKLCGGEVQRV